MWTAAKAAAGPFSTSLQLTETFEPSEPGALLTPGPPGCKVTVEIPYESVGGFFHVGPTYVEATAIDYES